MVCRYELGRIEEDSGLDSHRGCRLDDGFPDVVGDGDAVALAGNLRSFLKYSRQQDFLEARGRWNGPGSLSYFVRSPVSEVCSVLLSILLSSAIKNYEHNPGLSMI